MPFFRRVRFLTEYLLLRAVAGVFVLLSWENAGRLGKLLGRACAKIIRKRFSLTVDNIQKAFPEKTPQEAEAVAVKCWENLGRVIAEFAKSSAMSKEELLEKCPVVIPPDAREILARGGGAVGHIAHLANWEIAGMALSAAGIPACAVARKIRNPYLDEWINKTRRSFGIDIIGHRDPFFSCARAVRRGKFVGILMDQNFPAGDTFLPFFGRQAATSPLTALLALKTQTPIFPVRFCRDGERIKLIFEPPIICDGPYTEARLSTLLEKLNSRLEDWVRESPEMWLWAHNRWKREKDGGCAASTQRGSKGLC